MSNIMLEKFDQIGIVVKDIKKVANIYKDLFKFKGNINIVEQSSTVTYKGKELLKYVFVYNSNYKSI